MFKPGRAYDEGTTGVDGCATLNVGILKQVMLSIATADGPHYDCVLAHPQIDASRCRVVVPPMFGVAGPPLEIVFTEIK